MRGRIVLLAAVVGVGACVDGAGPAGDRLTAPEVEGLAEAVIGVGFDVSGDGASGAAAAGHSSSSSTQFDVSLPCPAGGFVRVEGLRVSHWDLATWSAGVELEATQTHVECARRVHGAVLTLDGSPDLRFEVQRAWENGVWAGLQTMAVAGGVDWRADDGRHGHCPVALAVSYDPDTRTRTVSGQVCHHEIHAVRTWTW